jgi:hypothetical protein
MTSLYTKECPSCAARNPADAGHCACGYDFASGTADSAAGENEAVNESLLLEDYLAARVDQALAEVESARSALAADPHEFRKAAYLLRIAQEARKLGEELHAQRVHTAGLRQTLGIENPESPITAPAQTERPGERFTAQQASRAQQIAARFEGTETKSCPQCGTVLPVSSLLCFCSYRFPLATEQTAERQSSYPQDPKAFS